MKVELSDTSYRLLQEQVNEGKYATIEAAAEASVLCAEAETQKPASTLSEEECAHIRALVQDGIRSASEGPLVDGEGFFAELRERRAKAA